MAVMVIVLRALHILGGIFWVGAVLTLNHFVLPAVKATRPASNGFLRRLLGPGGITTWITLAGTAAVVGGLVLFSPVSGHFDRDWMGSTRGVVLSVGALLGLAAYLESLAVLVPASAKYGALATAKVDVPQDAALEKLEAKIARTSARGGFVLGFAALFMAVARYV